MSSLEKLDSWKNLSCKLCEEILSALNALNFFNPTPVQESSIPQLLQNKDVAVEAITGSGKTLAFLIPLLEMIKKRKDHWKKHETAGLIIAPTSELARQIYEVSLQILQHISCTYHNSALSKITCQLLIGSGATVGSSTDDLNRLDKEGCNILVVTPGRLLQVIKANTGQGHLGFLEKAFKSLELLVLDEADRLFDLGFETQLNTILGFLPKQRRTGLFSATQTDNVEDLIRAGLRNPVRISVHEKNNRSDYNEKIPATLQNSFITATSQEKFNHLVSFLNENKESKIIVFFATCACVDYFSKLLKLLLPKREVISIHGKLRSKRLKVFESFRKSSKSILMCTDIMARGIDIPKVHWVIQYDPPKCVRSFVHRCGRTARIGEQGQALLYLRPNESAYINFLKINQKVQLENIDLPDELVDVIPKVKAACAKDKLLYEKGMKAFVSFVQFYRKHECHLIFRLKDLDFGDLANGFSLLRLPIMPELKNITVTGFDEANVDINSLTYKDKSVRKQRQLMEDRGELKTKKKPFKQNEPWSRSKELSRKRQRRREIKQFKRLNKEAEEKQTEAEEDDNEEDFSSEIQLMKKLKRGKISESDFNKQFCDDADSD